MRCSALGCTDAAACNNVLNFKAPGNKSFESPNILETTSNPPNKNDDDNDDDNDDHDDDDDDHDDHDNHNDDNDNDDDDDDDDHDNDDDDKPCSLNLLISFGRRYAIVDCSW